MVEKTATFTFRDDAKGVPRMRQFVSHWLRDAPLLQSDQTDFLLAVTEAITNACQHSGPRAHAIKISCSRLGERVSISVADKGSGFTPDPAAWAHEPALDQTGGRGLFLMRQLSDEVTVTSTKRGTTITLVRHGDAKN
jgi:serine/threonine-protein kinase RsbW